MTDESGERPHRAWWLLVLPPLLAAASAFAAQWWASEGFTSAPELGSLVDLAMLAWGIGPGMSMVGLAIVVLVARWRGRVAVLIGGLALLAFTAWGSWSIVTDDRSTAAIGFLCVPLYSMPLVVVTTLVVLLLTKFRPVTGGTLGRPVRAGVGLRS